MYKYNQISEYLHNKAMRARVPLSGTFELTPVCNMDCRMCYVRMSRPQQEAIAPLRTTEEWLELARTAKDRGMVFLLLTGGEPLLRPDFVRLLKEINAMGIVTTVNTNGTLITEVIADELVNAGPSKINITLYGASNETYNKLCGNPKGFSQVAQAIDLLQHRGIDVKINMSLTPYNIGDLEAMMAWCKERKLHCQVTSYMFPPIRKSMDAIGRNDRFTPEEAARAAVLSDCLDLGREVFCQKYEGKSYIPPAADDCMLPEEGSGIRCRAGGCSFWVTWQGIMLPCGIMPADHGCNAFEKGFDAAWSHVKAYTDAIRMPAKCSVCEANKACHTCAAMCVSETGAYDRVPQYRCDLYKAYAPAVEELLKSIKEGE